MERKERYSTLLLQTGNRLRLRSQPILGIAHPCLLQAPDPAVQQVGDWIAGFTSKKLTGVPVGEERLVYLMRVSEKIFFAEYWNDPRFEAKKPNLLSPLVTEKYGDNIYKPTGDGFQQIENKNHATERQKVKDLSGKYVLVATEFYYFGSEPVRIPDELRPSVPPGQSSQGYQTKDEDRVVRFLEYIRQTYRPGIHARPHCWAEHDESWMSDEGYTQP